MLMCVLGCVGSTVYCDTVRYSVLYVSAELHYNTACILRCVGLLPCIGMCGTTVHYGSPYFCVLVFWQQQHYDADCLLCWAAW
jgi:hypothetical protein